MREKQNDTKYRIMSKEAEVVSYRVKYKNSEQKDRQTLWVTVLSLCFSIRTVNLFCFVSEKRQLKISRYVIKRYKLPIIIPLYCGHGSRLKGPVGSEFCLWFVTCELNVQI